MIPLYFYLQQEQISSRRCQTHSKIYGTSTFLDQHGFYSAQCKHRRHHVFFDFVVDITLRRKLFSSPSTKIDSPWSWYSSPRSVATVLHRALVSFAIFTMTKSHLLYTLKRQYEVISLAPIRRKGAFFSYIELPSQHFFSRGWLKSLKSQTNCRVEKHFERASAS